MQLFVIDAPGAASSSGPLTLPEVSLSDEESIQPAATSSTVARSTGKKSAWHDPADEGLSVSLANNNRLRKLRENASEDVVKGKAYEKKLRQQYEKANPAPQWAAAARQRMKRKAEDTLEGEDGSDAEDAEGQAASKAAQRLLRRASHQVHKPMQLQPERIDIKRMADANQAVTSKVSG